MRYGVSLDFRKVPGMSTHTHACTQKHIHTIPVHTPLIIHQCKGYTILFWSRSYLESITVQAPQPPSPQPSLVPHSPTGRSSVKEQEVEEKSEWLTSWTPMTSSSEKQTCLLHHTDVEKRQIHRGQHQLLSSGLSPSALQSQRYGNGVTCGPVT